VSYGNPPTWGLANAPIRAVAEQCYYVDFSWEAVPPLVDLRGILVPAARVGLPAPGQYVRKR
jgi:hypothetical protein